MMKFKVSGINNHGLILRYCPGIHLKGLRKTMKSLTQDSHSFFIDFNMEHPKYEARVLTNQP
jgi:hypothetical protein